MSAEPKPGSVAEIVERAKQEIKDLLAVNSGDYTPTEAEKLNIDLMLRAEVTRAVEEAMKQAIEEFTRYHHNPIVTDKNKELQQLREQLESKDGYSIGYQTAKADYSAKLQQAKGDKGEINEISN